MAHIDVRLASQPSLQLCSAGRGNAGKTICRKRRNAVGHLKQEIERFAEEQSKTLKNAIYVGMMTDKAREYDQRRTRIAQLVEQLGKLEEG